MEKSYICITCDTEDAAAKTRKAIVENFNIDSTAFCLTENELHIPLDNEILIPLPLKDNVEFTLSQLEAFVYPHTFGIFTSKTDENGSIQRHWF